MPNLEAFISSFQSFSLDATRLFGRTELPKNILKELKDASKQIRRHQEKFPGQKWVTHDILKRLQDVSRNFNTLKSQLLEIKRENPNITEQQLRVMSGMNQVMGQLIHLGKRASSMESMMTALEQLAEYNAIASEDDKNTLKDELDLRDIDTITFTSIKDKSITIKIRKVKQVTPVEGAWSQVSLCEVFHGDVSRAGGWRKVALKELRAKHIEKLPDIEMSERMEQRLEREKAAWEELDHPNIAPLLGFVADPHYGLISPWYGNGHILNYIDKTPSANIVEMLWRISNALAFLHSKGLVHGDLRSPNVMVDDSGSPMIIDFGNTVSPVMVVQNGITPSVVPSVIRWMAPERVGSDGKGNSRNLSPTFASDTFSFGCLCIEVITRNDPFAHWSSDIDLFYAREKHAEDCSVNPRLLPAQRDGCEKLESNDPLWEVLLECWQQVPTQRPSMQNIEASLARLNKTKHSA
ncbi:hypothetical protein FRC03_001055 [Tulasnella sp. 419]|nr:hypothetical protein FRC03_001055 [Tulasnella sp. 419]